MLSVERSFSAERLNYILNHPAVRQDVADLSEGKLDLKKSVDNDKNILVMGEHGCVMFFCVSQCIYEAHTQILPEGRGAWAFQFVQSCAEFMFTKTDAMEILTRVPHGHIAAKALALKAGLKYEFTRTDCCVFRGQKVPVDIFSGRLQDWVLIAPDYRELGDIFHHRLNALAADKGVNEAPHEDDENHNQYIGICIKMMQGGQHHKAVAFYNRWAFASRHALVEIVSENPTVIKFDIGFLKINGNRIEDMEIV
jgi:hypothetical protein